MTYLLPSLFPEIPSTVATFACFISFLFCIFCLCIFPSSPSIQIPQVLSAARSSHPARQAPGHVSFLAPGKPYCTVHEAGNLSLRGRYRSHAPHPLPAPTASLSQTLLVRPKPRLLLPRLFFFILLLSRPHPPGLLRRTRNPHRSRHTCDTYIRGTTGGSTLPNSLRLRDTWEICRFDSDRGGFQRPESSIKDLYVMVTSGIV